MKIKFRLPYDKLLCGEKKICKRAKLLEVFEIRFGDLSNGFLHQDCVPFTLKVFERSGVTADDEMLVLLFQDRATNMLWTTVRKNDEPGKSEKYCKARGKVFYVEMVVE